MWAPFGGFHVQLLEGKPHVPDTTGWGLGWVVIPGRPVACKYGPPSINSGLLWGIAV